MCGGLADTLGLGDFLEQLGFKKGQTDGIVT
jgi:hypothetical protein